jgi:hypothetical protein
METIRNERMKRSVDIQKKDGRKDPYEKPILTCLGKVTNMTAGSVPGFGESQFPQVFRP